MARNCNYSAFYAAEPFNPGALGAHTSRDFCYYNLLRTWKGADSTFPFVDAHAATYSVRDGSDWELTLKPRLRARIRESKNLILFLSSHTVNSRALREEVDYAINDQGLPAVVVYPDYDSKESLLSNGILKSAIQNLWKQIPVFNSSYHLVPTIHVPMKKDLIRHALNDKKFELATKVAADVYRYMP